MKISQIYVEGVITGLEYMTDVMVALEEEGFKKHDDFQVFQNTDLTVQVKSLEKLNRVLHILTCFKFLWIRVKI